MNITDIDDKIIRGAAAAGDVDRRRSPTRYLALFLADAAALRMTTPDVLPRATEHIDADRRADRDAARAAATPTAPTTARSSSGSRRGRPTAGWPASIPTQLRVGERVEADEYGKDDVRDFALWKGPKPGEPVWDDGDRPGPARLAHRVLGDEHGPPRAVVRHPHRRRRPDLPAPRGRDRPERGGDRPAVRARPGSTAPTSRWAARRWPSRPGNIARVGDVLADGRLAAGAALRADLGPLPGAARLSRTSRWRRRARRSTGSTRPSPRSSAYREERPGRPDAARAAGGGARTAFGDGARRRPQRLGRRWPPSSTSSATSTGGSSARSLSTADAAAVRGRPARPRPGARRSCRTRRRRSTRSGAALLDARAAARAATRLGRLGPIARRAARRAGSRSRTRATASAGVGSRRWDVADRPRNDDPDRRPRPSGGGKSHGGPPRSGPPRSGPAAVRPSRGPAHPVARRGRIEPIAGRRPGIAPPVTARRAAP